MSAAFLCVSCKEPVDVTRAGFYREVSGWERTRAKGGANQIAFRRETGRLLHAGCAEQWKLRERMGVGDEQRSLL